MTKHCTRTESHSKIKVEENKRKAIFLNPERSAYDVTRVDDCLVIEGVRTDFLVSNSEEVSVLVELKGSDVSHACNQLFASAKHPNVTPLLKRRLGFLVVCSRIPRFDTFVIKAKNRAQKEFNAGFHVVKEQGEFDIHRVADIDGPY